MAQDNSDTTPPRTTITEDKLPWRDIAGTCREVTPCAGYSLEWLIDRAAQPRERTQ